MKLNFLIAPDFAPEHFAGWHLLNTALQRRTGIHLHLMTPVDAQEQTAAIDAGLADLVYANPFDATDLIRNRGYVPFARPSGRFDEMVIATRAQSEFKVLEDLRPACRIAVTDNRDVKLIGLRLLEPADLDETLVEWVHAYSYQAAARKLIQGDVQAAFFLADAYSSLSRLTHSQLHVLVESAIHDISHVLLAKPDAAIDLAALRKGFLSIGEQAGDAELLASLGMSRGFEPITQEQAEFMIDLMDTLLD